jgi:hypothetical protein
MGVSQRDIVPACCMPMGYELAVAGQRFGKTSRNQFGRTETGKTPIIPPDVQAKVFNYCEEILASAPEILNERDAGSNWGCEILRLIRIRMLHFTSCR